MAKKTILKVMYMWTIQLENTLMGNVLLFPGFTGGIESGLPVQPVTNTGCTKLYSPFPVHDPTRVPFMIITRWITYLFETSEREGSRKDTPSQRALISDWYRA